MLELLHHLNYARPFQGYVRVWNADIYHPSIDRWLYLFLHRIGTMGLLERKVIETYVHSGMSVLDVGGNVGLYTTLFSKCVGPQGKVITLEPMPKLHQSLLFTLEKNHLTNVYPLSYAAGAKEGTVNLVMDPLNSGNNWISKKPQISSVINIPVRSIDSLSLERPPDFVKIDVQGWEVEVLRGMTGLLATDRRPRIFCEVSDFSLRAAGSSSRELGHFFLDYNYTLHLPLAKKEKLYTVQMTLASLQKKALSTSYFDILALPQ